MALQLYANNAKTTLASSVTSTQTSITVASGTGALFPTPVAGVSAFKLTLVSATSPTTNEICLCTARSGDVLTVIRAQEGTTATAFALNDIAGNFDTKGVMDNLIQVDQLQNSAYTCTVAGGSANALTATLTSNFTTLQDRLSFSVIAINPNTGAATLTLTLGSTAQVTKSIVKYSGAPLFAGDIAGSGFICQLVYLSGVDAFILTNPATGVGATHYAATFNSSGSGASSGSTFNGSAPLTISYNSVGAPSTTGTNASGTWGINITGNANTATNANYANSAGSANTANSATTAGYATNAGNATTANSATTAGYANAAGYLNSFQGGNAMYLGWNGQVNVKVDGTNFGYIWGQWNSSNSFGGWFGSGYQKFANGLIIQWGFASIPTGNANPVFFPTSFPNYCTSIISSDSGSVGVPSACYSTGHTDTYNGYFIAFMRDYNGNYVAGNYQYVAFGF